MKITLTRLLTVVMLIIVSMGAKAQVKVLFGENGDDKFKSDGEKIEATYDGGTIVVTQKTVDATKVTVYLTVTPNKGYTMQEKNVIEAYAVIPADANTTRALTVSEKLTPDCEGFKDEYSVRTYYVDIDPKLALWVKSANFVPNKRENGAKAGTPQGTDRSGIFYFVNGGSGKTSPVDPKIDDQTNPPDPDDYFYLVPADNPRQDNKRDAWFSSDYNSNDGNKETPYLTTYKTKKDAADIPSGVTERPHNSVWIVEFASTDTDNNNNKIDYYYLIHAATGKYVVYDPPYSNNWNRKSVHLLTTTTPGENAKFAITTHQITINSINYDTYNFRPISRGTGANDNKYLNAANANYNFYYSSEAKADGDANYFQGLVGLWKDAGGGSDWKPEATLLDAPTISDPDVNNKVTIADANSLPSGYVIRYTMSTDGTEPDDPTATTGFVYDPNDLPQIQATGTKIKAVVVRYGMVLTEVASETREPAPCATPVITFDYTTSEVSITCATEGCTIKYSTDGGDPTTDYSSPFSVTSPTTVKAIATHANFPNSAVAELAISQVATPTIQDNGHNAISIKTTTLGATIYYTTNGSTPTPGVEGSFKYTEPLTENVSNVDIKAIAVKENMITSAVGNGTVMLQCATPVITRDGMKFTLSCSFPTDADLYYKLDGGSEVAYDGTPVSFTTGQLPMTVTAVARHSNYTESETASFELLNGSGTPDDPYLIYSTTDFTNFVSKVNDETTSSACYKLEIDVSGSDVDAITTAFTGTFDGGMHTISGLGHALFNTVNGGVVKNVILDNVSISGGTTFTVDETEKVAIGAIANVAKGAARIYNCGILATNSTKQTNKDGYTEITSCSSSVGGTADYVGGLVGFLDEEARVINCFSYANITGGTEVGGIVGRNNVVTTSANLQTMVMNCMFYGNITSGTSKAPIYNGEIISNVGATGVGNYNYFLADATYTGGIDTHNCALMAEKRFLQRFEFFRLLMNSHRELAGWWATGSFSKTEIAKWVLEPSQIGTATPYPILKASKDQNGNEIQYPSMVNLVKDNLKEFSSDEEIKKTQRNQGRKFGTLAVTIQMDDTDDTNVPYHHPNGASLKETSLTIPITDKDPEHFNFNYYKVQLPYYNDVGTKNYTGNRVMTGWKIVSINGGTLGSLTAGDDATASVNAETGKVTLTTPYNFADRHCTNKDLYSSSGRVFNQGAYFDVPEGVTAITIEPYWAKCVYLADANADVVYNNKMNTASNVSNVGGGTIYTDGNSYSIAGENQVVHTTMGNAISSSNSTGLFVGVTTTNHTVYDYAVVLVGNYHHYYTSTSSIESSNSKPYTVTSIDLDGDNEPDYSYIMRFDGRAKVHPVRVDFLNVPGLGMAQKSTGSTGSYNFGIMLPKDWFEVTNTALFRVTQFEYEQTDRAAKPLILHGGVIEQWVSAQSQGIGIQTTYIHVGSNVWFKEFHLGCHQDKNNIATKHPPVSVTGGDYGEFYLTGLYATTINYNDNAECYINGGRFGKVAGAGTEGIGNASANGNIVWQIQNADIEEFYGGGTNAAKPIEGNITTVITGSHVKRFCGGPKFGDMNPGKTVITIATNCTFGSFFGAGYGGNSYYRAAPGNFATDKDPWDTFNVDWNDWIAGTTKGKSVNNGNYANGDTYSGYDQTYNSHFGGVSTRFDYQFLPQSSNEINVARLFIDFVKFSLATTRNVTSTLTGCTITSNFYGGGSLGKVDGTVTSTLTDCTVHGNVFGGGYDASRPTVEVMSTTGFDTPPNYDKNTGVFFPAAEPYTTSEEYSWEYSATVNSTATAIDKTNHILYTTANLNTLGQVTGKVTLNILGNTLVEGFAVDYEGNPTGGDRGGVFGGGDASAAQGDTEININTPTTQTEGGYNVYNVFGGGNKAPVGGNTTVNLKNGVIQNNVFGGGNEGVVEGSATVNME